MVFERFFVKGRCSGTRFEQVWPPRRHHRDDPAPTEVGWCMTKPKGRLDALLDGLGIKLVPIYRRRAAAQSHARGTMHEIRNQYGDGHLIFVLRCIRESRNNRDELWSETIGAVSDILIQRPDWALERAGDVLDAFDHIKLGPLRGEAVARCPWPVRASLRILIYKQLETILDQPEQRFALRS